MALDTLLISDVVRLMLKGIFSLRPDTCTDAFLTPKSCITKLHEKEDVAKLPAKSATRDTDMVNEYPINVSN